MNSDVLMLHICSFTEGTYRIMVEGELFIFEMSDRFGPLFIGKKGESLKNQPRPRHKVWEAVSLWSQQGKNVGDDGICIWKPAPDPREGMINIYGNTWVTPKIYETLKNKADEEAR